jgi:predicted N-acyltransferase
MAANVIDDRRAEETMRKSPQLNYRWHKRSRDISPQTWDECFSPSIEGRFWYETLESCGLDDQFDFFYLEVFDQAQRTVAIAPAFVMNVPLQIMAPTELEQFLNAVEKVLPFVTRIRTVFVGSPCADEATIGVRPEVTLDTVLPLVDKATKELARTRRAPMIVWKDFCHHDAEMICSMAGKSGLLRICSYPGADLKLPEGNFDSYLASLRKSRRQNLKRKLESSRKTGKLTAEVVTHPDEGLQDEMFKLFWMTYEKGTTKFEKLNTEFFRVVSEKAPSRFLLLRDESGKLLAFRLFFQLDNKIINKFIGIDYSAPPGYFLLFRLVEEGIRYALSNGTRVVQSGQTGYAPKFETGHTLVPLYNFIHHRNPIIHQVLKRFVAPTISWDTVDKELTEYLKKHPDALPRENLEGSGGSNSVQERAK